MEGQWGFLAPWCQVLQGEVNYMGSECSASPFMERSLCVWLPERDHLEGVTRGVDISDADHEDLFRKQFQKTREAMALLAAVAHVDYGAWRFLLEKFCGVDFGLKGPNLREENSSSVCCRARPAIPEPPVTWLSRPGDAQVRHCFLLWGAPAPAPQ